MSRWRCTLLLCVALAVMFGSASAQNAVVSRGFWVENPRIDLGEVRSGTPAVATFVFHNDGPKDVNIIRAKPS